MLASTAPPLHAEIQHQEESAPPPLWDHNSVFWFTESLQIGSRIFWGSQQGVGRDSEPQIGCHASMESQRTIRKSKHSFLIRFASLAGNPVDVMISEVQLASASPPPPP